MLVIINATGLNKLYLMPKIERSNNKKGVWYWSITWLSVEFLLYSKAMGTRMIELLDTFTATQGE